MNAIEIRNLTKKFGDKCALNGLNASVPVGSIYGFIGENGSGKSTTEKIICGLIHPTGGEIKLFGKDYTDPDVRAKTGVLIETPGCFANLTVWRNLSLQAANLSLENPDKHIKEVLELVRMEGAAGNKYKNCSLGMKQRVGIAMALLGDPELLVLDEPINGLDADGMRIMREILIDLSARGKTVLVSSHVLSELEKVATHYGIIRGGKMIKEMTAEELNQNCRTYTSLKVKDKDKALSVLKSAYNRAEQDDKGYLRVYDKVSPQDVVTKLYHGGIVVQEVTTERIGLEEYYTDLMAKKGDK
ncbi:MAG: ATP-binding cassette domain-containing protein [Clostridia bacterium]|nr:ATP-binding cassette domain-containing protein [Clostridia bacterium]